MGWASYLEDIIERNREDYLKPVENFIENPPCRLTSLQFERLTVLLDKNNKVLLEIQQLLELSTDPDLNLAFEYRKLREYCEDIEKKINKEKKNKCNLLKEVDTLKKDIEKEHNARQVAETAVMNEEGMKRLLKLDEHKKKRPDRGGL